MNLAKKIRLALPVALATAIAPISAIAEGTLNVYNWGEYIGEETIANFEKEFGIEVTYDNYDSVETADAKLPMPNCLPAVPVTMLSRIPVQQSVV